MAECTEKKQLMQVNAMIYLMSVIASILHGLPQLASGVHRV